MSPRCIEVTVSPQGETQIATSGFVGHACQQATAALEQALGLRQSQQLTSAAFHPTETTSETQQTA